MAPRPIPSSPRDRMVLTSQEGAKVPPSDQVDSQPSSQLEQAYADTLLWARLLKDKQHKLDEEIRNLNSKHQETATKAGDRINELHSVTSSLNSRVQDLEATIDELDHQHDINELHNNSSTLDDRVTDLESRTDRLGTDARAQMQAQVTALTEEVKVLTAYCVNWKNEAKAGDKKLEDSIAELQAKLDEMEGSPRMGELRQNSRHGSDGGSLKDLRAGSEATTMDTDMHVAESMPIDYGLQDHASQRRDAQTALSKTLKQLHWTMNYDKPESQQSSNTGKRRLPNRKAVNRA